MANRNGNIKQSPGHKLRASSYKCVQSEYGPPMQQQGPTPDMCQYRLSKTIVSVNKITTDLSSRVASSPEGQGARNMILFTLIPSSLNLLADTVMKWKSTMDEMGGKIATLKKDQAINS